MSDASPVDEKRMRLRFAGTCRVCGIDIPARTPALYERSTRTVRCLAHDERHDVPAVDGPLDVGTPGASARREFERRRDGRERRLRARYPRIGGFLLAVSDEPQSTAAWNTGALGEERLGSTLNELASDRLRILHDRRIPGSRANIDHLAVTPTGIYVIDAKKHAGRPRLKVEGGVLRPRVEKLVVGSRDCTRLVDGVLKQVDVVRGVVGDDVAVHAVLCFVEADWPLIGGSFATRGVSVLWPRKLYPLLAADGSMTLDAVERTHRDLAAALRPA
ncbi:NERD domain-containing protein [Aeromicrobium fastidiosum]|uniref:nuclease-related domain-containing protein n=1 Tax=Aeromicrobium fastidiosum TaxID=52699 RepID=UPI00202340EC|nr:nuclease-related domain-containing protein [Aeromicrobium fastidiosum]MCL8251433.1 NERD domain-containing protein [Aeromicrobium fastidiosum]